MSDTYQTTSNTESRSDLRMPYEDEAVKTLSENPQPATRDKTRSTSKVEQYLRTAIKVVPLVLVMGLTTLTAYWWQHGGKTYVKNQAKNAKRAYNEPVSFKMKDGSELRVYWNKRQVQRDRNKKGYWIIPPK